jgi:hypothetical protein
MARLELTVGRLLCGSLRDELNRMKFEGHNIDFWESSGFFQRDFVIKGDEKSLRLLDAGLMDWQERLQKCQKK